jgi:hypothetical protein
MLKIITWVDLQGRYRVTSPAYGSLALQFGFSEDDPINWTWTNIIESGLYGITYDHLFYLVEDADQRERLVECCGTYFRFAKDGDPAKSAWLMSDDGRPVVDMLKAQYIHMDNIRTVRNRQLEKESGSRDRQPLRSKPCLLQSGRQGYRHSEIFRKPLI